MPAFRLFPFVRRLGLLALFPITVPPTTVAAQQVASYPAPYPQPQPPGGVYQPVGVYQMYWTDSAAPMPPGGQVATLPTGALPAANPYAMTADARVGPAPAPVAGLATPCVVQTQWRGLFWQPQAPVVILPSSTITEQGLVRVPQPPSPCEASTPMGRGLFSLGPSLDGKDSREKDFTARLTIPLAYSSSPISSVSDSSLGNKGDWHATPEVALKWSHQFDSARIAGEIGANVDRYRTATDVNSDMLFSSLKAEAGDSSWDTFRPYVRYSNSLSYIPTFRSLDVAFHDFALGFTSAIGSRNGQRISYSDTERPGDISLYFDLKVVQRLSDISDYDRTSVKTALTGAYYFDDKWRIEATANFSAYWYKNYFGDQRTDYRPGANLSLIWKPDWLRKLASHSELSLNFNVERNYSNLSEKRYTNFELGPTLELRTKF
jgi:hypothetical protein